MMHIISAVNNKYEANAFSWLIAALSPHIFALRQNNPGYLLLPEQLWRLAFFSPFISLQPHLPMWSNNKHYDQHQQKRGKCKESHGGDW